MAGPGTGRLLPRNKNASARHRGTAGTGLLAAGAGGWRRRGSTTLAEEWGQQTCWAAPPPPAKSRMESFPAHLPIQRSQAVLTWPDGAQADKYLFKYESDVIKIKQNPISSSTL